MPSAVPLPGVGVTDLARALGTYRSALLRAVEAGTIAPPDRVTPGGHRRWSFAAAAKVLRREGRNVPRAWARAK